MRRRRPEATLPSSYAADPDEPDGSVPALAAASSSTKPLSGEMEGCGAALARLADVALLLCFVAHIVFCPFTKVEESFNVQASHDMLFHGRDLPSYDHHMFPGVVPRTFLGSLAISMIAKPIVTVLGMFGLIGGGENTGDRVLALIIVRILLSLQVWYGLYLVRCKLSEKFGHATGIIFAAASLLQFHLPFYAGRPLPNTFALVFVVHAWRWIIQGNISHSKLPWYVPDRFLAFHAPLSSSASPVPTPVASSSGLTNDSRPSRTVTTRATTLIAVQFLVVAAVFFRCDVVVLLVPVLLMDLVLHLRAYGCSFSSSSSWAWNMLVVGAVSGFGSLAITVLVDSHFWRRWLWPEFEVFLFNTVENKSSDWGTEPWYWYFTSALPRSCLAAYPLAALSPFGLLVSHGRAGPRFKVALRMLLPAFSFVALYSFLPHKELRFIFYALPAFNVAASLWIGGLWEAWKGQGHSLTPQKRCNKSTARNLSIFFLLTIAAGSGAVILFAGASYNNYPGGDALRRLHKLSDQGGSVHVGVRAAMTGVSRYGYVYGSHPVKAWTYSKDETLTDPSQFEDFDFLVTDNPKFHREHFEILDNISAFAGGGMSVIKRLLKFQWPFESMPTIWIMQKKR